MQIKADHLQVLLNELWLADRRHLEITLPLWGLTLGSVDLESGRLRMKLTAEDLAKRRDELCKASAAWDDWPDEIPTTTSLAMAFVSAGILPVRNAASVAKAVREELEASQKTTGDLRPFFLCYDTNVLYNKFASQHLASWGIPPRSVRHALSRLCNRELEQNVARKVQPPRRNAQLPKELLPLLGQPAWRSRRAKEAIAESAWLQTRMPSRLLDGATWDDDKERRDKLLVHEYEEFARAHRVNAMLLTFDRDVGDIATANGLAHEVLELSYFEDIPDTLEPDDLARLLPELATSAACVGLRGGGVEIWGTWKGRTASMERERVLELKLDGNVLNEKELSRSLSVVEKIRGILG